MADIRMLEMNETFVTGRITRDLELKYTPSNQAVVSFSIASNRRFKDAKTGEWREIASFIPVVAWSKLAERCANRCKKGSPVFVSGRLQSRSWETKTGDKRWVLELVADKVQFLAKATDPSAGPTEENTTKTENTNTQTVDDINDIPF